MKKIIYFDVWPREIQNYCYIDKILQNEYRTLLLHSASFSARYFASHIDTSWYTFKNEQMISGILCKDISAYKGMTIMDILKTEAPDVVVQLDVSHLQNRIVTVACKRLGIKVVFMMHGAIRTLGETHSLITDFSNKNKFNIPLKIKKARKHIKFLQEYYAASGNISDTLNIIRQMFLSPFRFIWNPLPHYSLNVDKAFVYTIDDINSLSEVFGIPPEHIMATGNPKLDHALPELHRNAKNQSAQSHLLYLESSLRDLKLMNDSQQMNILSLLSKTAKRNGFEFVIRLHPSTNRKNFIQVFGSEYQYSSEGESLKDSLIKATIIAGHASTAMLEGIAYRIPTITISWFEGALQRIVVDENDVGIVRQERMFEEKLREFLKNGWMQEEARKKLFPMGEDVPAAEIIAGKIRKLAE